MEKFSSPFNSISIQCCFNNKVCNKGSIIFVETNAIFTHGILSLVMTNVVIETAGKRLLGRNSADAFDFTVYFTTELVSSFGIKISFIRHYANSLAPDPIHIFTNHIKHAVVCMVVSASESRT